MHIHLPVTIGTVTPTTNPILSDLASVVGEAEEFSRNNAH